MIGKEIGIYRIVQKIGEGGMGVVYKAIDLNLDRFVAIKLLGGDFAEHSELAERFHAEARVQAGLSHLNLATLFAFLVWEGTPVMVMEFIQGETFQQMVARRGPIPSEDAVPLFQQALCGIAVAHHRGIVHRDIKPANIMVNEEGIVKVMDFGIAKVLGVSGATRTNMQMGTSWYMSPEQVLSQPVDARSDIYSLGVTLYEMLSGHAPFRGDSDFAIQMAHVQREPEPLPAFSSYIPVHVVAATMKALAKKPEDRFASVEAFNAALGNPVVAVAPPPPLAAHDSALPIEVFREAQSEPRVTFPPLRPRAKWGWVAGGLLLLAVLATGFLYFKRVALARERVAGEQREAEKRRQAGAERDRQATLAREGMEPEPPSVALPSLPPPAVRSPAVRKKPQTVVPISPQIAGVRHPLDPVPIPPLADAGTDPLQRLAGVWQGSYTCAQEQIAASVLITPKPGGISAVMSFSVPNNPKPGTYLLAGTFDLQTRKLILKFVRWGIHPPEYVPADLAGTVNLQQGIITGTVIAPGCSTFTIRHRGP